MAGVTGVLFPGFPLTDLSYAQHPHPLRSHKGDPNDAYCPCGPFGIRSRSFSDFMQGCSRHPFSVLVCFLLVSFSVSFLAIEPRSKLVKQPKASELENTHCWLFDRKPILCSLQSKFSLVNSCSIVVPSSELSVAVSCVSLLLVIVVQKHTYPFDGHSRCICRLHCQRACSGSENMTNAAKSLNTNFCQHHPLAKGETYL